MMEGASNSSPGRTGPSTSAAGRLAAPGVAAVWLGVAGAFAWTRELWLDEVTQLAGLAHGPVDTVRWLAGAGLDLGAPPDRAPPLSYLVGQVWAIVAGQGVLGFRLLGVLAVAAGLWVLVRAAVEVGGPAAGWVTGLSLALSPNALAAGVEVRAYPFLLALACALFAWTARALARPGPRGPGLELAAAAGAWTHFFGLVAAGAAALALAPAAWREAAARRRWLLGAGGVALAALPLAPFAVAAARLGPNAGTAGVEASPAAAEVARGALRLAYRLLGGHPAGAAWLLPAALAVLATAALLGLALAAEEGPARRAARGLALGLAAGLGASLLARLALRDLDALLPSYALWALPPIALAAGLGAAAGGRRRLAGLALGAALVAGQAASAAVLLRHHEVYANAPSARLAAEVAAAGGAGEVLVVHDGDARHAVWPLRALLGPGLRQATLDEVRARPALLAGERRVLLVTTRALGAGALGALVRGAPAPALADPAAGAWLAAQGFRARGGRTLPGFRACEVERFERAEAPNAAP